RVKKVDAHEVLLKIVGEGFGDGVDRDAARVRGNDAPGLAVLFNLGKKFVLYFKILDDRLDHQITIFDRREIVGKVSELDKLRIVRKHERRGLQLLCSLEE